ncbi:hypothetical protein DP939_27620 [Spongiactinospora rosea]|uniref:FG-GAP repeat protein n=1 Tax=Spongiactinospora rosea TaxID=2248750 RepID=A0A366LSE4_9ACTN|nr:FG-GAP repeat protein [Spongiactinospora rosea]RBQ16841.1 hypothetical protein DP939_27620 [Spongiactinospora rosea]
MTRMLIAALLLAALPIMPAGTRAAKCDHDVAIGDPFADVRGLAGAGVVQFAAGSPGGGTPVPVSAPDAAAGDAFGWSVTIGRFDADGCADLLVGAPYADVGGIRDAGAAYVVYGGTGRADRITAREPQLDAHFGWSVAYSPDGGGVAAVGAPHEDDNGVHDAGAVHLFPADRRTALTRITQNGVGVPGSSEAGDMFGWSLALDRLTGDPAGVDLAVGTPYENEDGAGIQNGQGLRDTGALTVLLDPLSGGGEYAGVRWGLAELRKAGEPVRPAAGDRFGYALAASDGRLAVSAPLAGAGLVHVFAGGLKKGVTVARGDRAGAGFGFSVALSPATPDDGVRLAAGVPYAGPDARGAVWLVPLADRTAGRLITSPAAGAHFGWAVAFTGNRLLIGSPDTAPGGSAGLLGRNQSASTPITPAPGTAPVDFGAAIAG